MDRDLYEAPFPRIFSLPSLSIRGLLPFAFIRSQSTTLILANMSSDFLDEKKEQRIEVEHISDADASAAIDHPSHPETRMTRVKWLACIALSLSYTTAFQQNACTAAIVKHIDAELGKSAASLRS